MKALALATITWFVLLALTGCTQARSSQDPKPTPPDQMTVSTNLPTQATRIIERPSYDDVFTDINHGVFTTREPLISEDNGNYFRCNRIDVVDANGFDHQGIVVVCEGANDFTQAYRVYVGQLMEIYGDDMGTITGYRNAATKGHRTYRDMDINFFCIQDVVFADRDGTERRGVVVALDGSDEYVEREAFLYSDFRDAYSQKRT